jgi:mono/diheme cytochrome c family protein
MERRSGKLKDEDSNCKKAAAESAMSDNAPVLASIAEVLVFLYSAAMVPDAGAATGSPSFARAIAPVLASWCARCHGPREQNGGLRLDSYGAVMRGGDSGPPVIAGDVAGSLLVAKIERRDRPPMPPRRRLPAALVARVRAWIEAGARP